MSPDVLAQHIFSIGSMVFWYCSGLWRRLVIDYGARDAMLIFFGVFALISFALARREYLSTVAGKFRMMRSPLAGLAIKGLEAIFRAFASASLVLGMITLAHYRGVF